MSSKVQRLKLLFRKGLASLSQRGLRVTLSRVVSRLRFRPKRAAQKIVSAYPEEQLQAQREHRFSRQVTFSILVPLYNTPVDFLGEMIRSVQAQTYGAWELCLTDGSDSAHREVGETVRSFQALDSRIKYRRLEQNLGISGNTNACFALATGEYFSLLDHDDVLHPAALYETMTAICEQGADFIYTDEATFVSPDLRKIITVHCKPDFAPDNLRANNYICHFTSFSRALIDQAGKFRSEYDGSQDHDMMLRLTACAHKIVHIPKVLYFWRSHSQSAAMDIGAKAYAISAGRRAVEDALRRSGWEAQVTSSEVSPTIYRVRYALKEHPKVSIMIAASGDARSLERCVESILKQTAYPDYEILVIHDPAAGGALLPLLNRSPRLRGCPFDGWRNRSAAYNHAAASAEGSVILLLSECVEVVRHDWLEELLMYAQREDVGAVGALMYLPNGTVSHAGMILGFGREGIASSPFRHSPKGSSGYMGRLGYTQNLSAVSGDCMMVRKEVFRAASGFDSAYRTKYADVDFCLRLSASGRRIVWNPFAELVFHPRRENRTSPADADRFRRRWSAELAAGDAYYNPNFTLDGAGFRIDLKK